jgi:phosphatidate cytidylyltransferase
MLGWRLVLGPVLILALVGLFKLDLLAGPAAPVLMALACCLALRSTWELVQLLRVRFEPNFRLLASAGLAVVSANWWTAADLPGAGALSSAGRLGPPFIVYALAVMGLFVSGLVRFRAPGKAVETLGAELVTLSYIAVFISLTVQLRWISGGHLDYLPLASLIVATKCGDTAAYFTGRLLGKTKLSPLISPGKTRAGAVGALCGAAAGSWAAIEWGAAWLGSVRVGTWYWSVLFGLIVGLTGLVGDLAESVLKRDLGKKDSAPLLPGFGGLLDLLDSVIFAGPVAYLLWLILPLTQPA